MGTDSKTFGKSLSLYCSDGSGSKIFDPGRVNFLWLGSGWVGSAIYGLGLNLENFP